MKILAIADLHDSVQMLPSIEGLGLDLIVFAGDLHNGSSRLEARPAAEALAGLGPPVLIVPGNTDHRDVVPDLWEEAGLINIHRGSHVCGECGFVGLGGMVARNPGRLGDPSRYYLRDGEFLEALSESFKKISGSRHRIVVTHQPPLSARDRIYTGENVGSPSLSRFVQQYEPDLLICGHIHEDRGEAAIGRTRVVNVGEMRRGYAAVIEIGEEMSLSWIEPR